MIDEMLKEKEPWKNTVDERRPGEVSSSALTFFRKSPLLLSARRKNIHITTCSSSWRALGDWEETKPFFKASSSLLSFRFLLIPQGNIDLPLITICLSVLPDSGALQSFAISVCPVEPNISPTSSVAASRNKNAAVPCSLDLRGGGEEPNP
jgi:hypothetical protein